MNRRVLLRVSILTVVVGLGSSVALVGLPAAANVGEVNNSETNKGEINSDATQLGAWLHQQLAQQVNWQGGPPPRWGGGR